MTQKFLHKRLVRRLISEAGRACKAEARKSDTRPRQRCATGPMGGSGGGRAIVSGGRGCSGVAESGVWRRRMGYSGVAGMGSDVLGWDIRVR
jgi:hypothetical protein